MRKKMSRLNKKLIDTTRNLWKLVVKQQISINFYKFLSVSLATALISGMLVFPPKQARAAVLLKIPSSLGMNTGLVGYWTMDGADTNWTANTTSDKSGNGNTGTITNMSTTTSPVVGKIGQGLKFDGVNDEVDVNNSASLGGMPTLTVSLWMKLSSNLTNGVIPLTKRHSGFPWNAYYFNIDKTNGRIQATFANSSGAENTFCATENNSLVYDQWFHFVAVYNGANCYAYMNGTQSTSVGVLTGSIFVSDGLLYIGGGPGGYTMGNIDEVRIYNRALSASEIRQLYLMGK